MSNIKNLTKEEREQIFREVLHEHNLEEAREYCERFLDSHATDKVTDEEFEQTLNSLDYEEMARRFEQKKSDDRDLNDLIMDLWCDVTDDYLYYEAGLDYNKYDI